MQASWNYFIKILLTGKFKVKSAFQFPVFPVFMSHCHFIKLKITFYPSEVVVQISAIRPS